MTRAWDPDRYLAYADERGRPFLDLLQRVAATAPRQVVDLGCGPGNLTALLARRWPDAMVVGVDSSPEMVERARSDHGEGSRGLGFELGDVRTWAPGGPLDRQVDVMVANAVLQWVPGHLELLPRLVGQVAPGGWICFQVPGNHTEPSHVLLHELAADPRFAPWTRGVARPQSHDPQVYAAALLGLGPSVSLAVDVWETTYLHLLAGEDPVFTWISGTGARPTLAALPDGLREAFAQEYRALLSEAYPPGPHGTFLPFRRVFAVARVPGVG